MQTPLLVACVTLIVPALRGLRRTVLPLSVFVFLAGCVEYSKTTITRGKPIEEATASRIVIGRTTRSEIFSMLGVPHSIFEGQVQFHQDESIRFDPTLFYRYAEQRYLASLDDEHYALLYRFSESKGRTLALTPILVSYRSARVSLNVDELLLLVNKKTQIVDDVAYRRDTSK